MGDKRYVEYVEGGTFHGKNYIELVTLERKRRDVESYTSMYIYDEDVIKHIQDQINDNIALPSIKGYRGGLYMNYLWIDIDFKLPDGTGDIPKSTMFAKFAIERINSNYELPYESMVIYFSGGKGYHIGIPSECFGAKGMKYEKLPSVSKIMVGEMMGGEKMFDTSIYDYTRFFRVPNSKHQKTGLYKTEIDYNLILNLDSDKAIELATTNTREIPHKYAFSNNEKLFELFKVCIEKAEQESEAIKTVVAGSILDNSTVFSIPEVGGRNRALMRMAYRLFMIPNGLLKNQEVVDLLKFVVYTANAINPADPLTTKEVNATINQMYKETRAKSIKTLDIETVGSMVKKVYEQIKNAKHISSLIDVFDKDLRGGFANQDLYCIIGKGGTMKSYWLQDLQMHSSVNNNETNLYLNMEMSKKLFFERAFGKFIGSSFADAVDSGKINDSTIDNLTFKLDELFEKKLLIVNQNNLTPTEVGDAIKRKEDELKVKIRSCVADSMNAMKVDEKGGEVTAAFNITKELKEVSKETNTAVMLINHANASCPETLRDVSGFCRGGSKPIDNCDAHFSLSKIVDEDKSDRSGKIEDLIYKPGYVWIRLVNKRNSGNTIDRICTLNSQMSIEDTGESTLRKEELL